jgi:CRISPR/Cas system-associated protein Csx1
MMIDIRGIKINTLVSNLFNTKNKDKNKINNKVKNKVKEWILINFNQEVLFLDSYGLFWAFRPY